MGTQEENTEISKKVMRLKKTEKRMMVPQYLEAQSISEGQEQTLLWRLQNKYGPSETVISLLCYPD